MTNTLYMKRAIADYIIDVLRSNDLLNEIAVFIRGAFPPGMIPQELYPFVEVFIGSEVEDTRFTGAVYEQTYTGIVTVSMLATELASGDWVERESERFARVPSYDKVEEFVYAIMRELQKSEHLDMASLSLNDEVVIQFALTGERIYGIDRDVRSNSWENFGSVPFTVETQRQRLT